MQFEGGPSEMAGCKACEVLGSKAYIDVRCNDKG